MYVENKYIDTKKGKGIGIAIYTLLILCIKQITNEDLLYSTGNSIQCSVVTYKLKTHELA